LEVKVVAVANGSMLLERQDVTIPHYQGKGFGDWRL
jgi:hypothetical protein